SSAHRGLYSVPTRRSSDLIIENYADTTVAIADIKIAVRSRKTGKSGDFMRSAMAECRSVNAEQLIRAALSGEEEIARYLEGTSRSEEHTSELQSRFDLVCR